jgi:hypothetical protein
MNEPIESTDQPSRFLNPPQPHTHHRYYRSPETSLRITALIYLSWFLGFSGLFLLPFDLSDVQTYGSSAPWIFKAWQGIYWSTFGLTWLVLPTTYAFIESGYFTFRDRLLDALRSQLRTACFAAAALLAFVAFLLVQGDTLAGVEGLLMALSNTYGLLFVVVLLGNGVVEIPRRLWNASFPEKVRECYRRCVRRLFSILYHPPD